MLPARLGDVARAYLAGRSFGISRLAVLGTVVVERLADGLFILGLVVVLGLAVAGGESLASTAAWLAAIAAAGGAVLLVGLLYLRRSGGGRIWGRLRSLVDRVLRGAEALRTPTTLVSSPRSRPPRSRRRWRCSRSSRMPRVSSSPSRRPG